jgi:hypothetical protein
VGVTKTLNQFATPDAQPAQFDRRSVAMNSLTQLMPVGPTVSRGRILKQFFAIGYLTAIGVAMVGWVTAFGWVTFRLAKWLLA